MERKSSGPPAKGNEGNARPRGGETPQPTRRQGRVKRICRRARSSGPPRLRPCLRAVWGVGENVAGVPPCGGSPAHLLACSWGCSCVQCSVPCVCVWLCLVACLSCWWGVWLVAVPLFPVCLALCNSRGFCLCGLCLCRSRLFLAGWCGCGAPGCCTLQGVKNPLPGNQQPGRGIFCQHQRRWPQKATMQEVNLQGLRERERRSGPCGRLLMDAITDFFPLHGRVCFSCRIAKTVHLTHGRQCPARQRLDCFKETSGQFIGFMEEFRHNQNSLSAKAYSLVINGSE